MSELHRKVSIDLLKSISSFAVRTPRGQKDPGHMRWDPRSNTQTKSEAIIYELGRNTDNLGVHLFGNSLDVDIDTDNPLLMEALDLMLPFTPHIWGRKSRPRTHRFYEVVLSPSSPAFHPRDFPFLQVLEADENLKVEIRGGEMKAGQYSLLPGSLHPSGEEYEWTDIHGANVTPVATDLMRVVNGVRFACVAAKIAEYWNEGSRNSLCMAFSGFLFRACQHIEDMGSSSGLYFGKPEALEILRTVMTIANDDEADEQMRIRTFEKTWDKAEAGDPVSGASTIEKITGDKEIIALLYTLMADTPALVELDDFMARYAVRNNTSNVIDLEKAGDRNAVSIMTVNDFRNSYMHKTVQGASGKSSMVNILLASSRAVRVEGFTFDPRTTEKLVEEHGGLWVNQWQGHDIPPHEDEATKADVQPFLTYVWEVLAQQDTARYHWVLAWIADLFQRPHRKSGTALALIGKPGSGKSMLGAKFLRPIIGRNHSMATNTLESLVGNFNADSGCMLLVQCDEATNSRRKADAMRLKSMITDEMRRIEPKGINAYQQPDYARYVFTSNEYDDALAILDGNDDRRFTVLETLNVYATQDPRATMLEKQNFWGPIYGWAEVEHNKPHVENLSKLHRYLLDYDYEEADVRLPLETQMKRNLSQHSQRGLDDFLMQIINSESPFDGMNTRDGAPAAFKKDNLGHFVKVTDDWPTHISYTRLEEAYEAYRRKRGVVGSTPAYNAQQLKDELKRRGILRITKNEVHRIRYKEETNDGITNHRVRVSDFPSRKDMEQYLDTKFGFRVDEATHDYDLTQKDEF